MKTGMIVLAMLALARFAHAAQPMNLENFNGHFVLDPQSNSSVCSDQLTIIANSATQSVSISPDLLSMRQGAMVLGNQYCTDDPAQTFVQDCDSIVASGADSLIRVYTQQQNPLGFVPAPQPIQTLTESFTMIDNNHLKMITRDSFYCFYTRKGDR